MHKIRNSNLTKLIIALYFSFLFSSLSWAEEIEVIEEVSEVEKNDYDKSLEERLSADIESYLSNKNYVLSVDAQLEKKSVYSITEPNQGNTLPQRLDIVTRSPSDLDILDSELPGVVSVPPAQDSLTADPFRSDYDSPREEVAPVKSLLSSVINVKRQTIKLILDERISAMDEGFIRNLVAEKANVNLLRGDQLIVTKTQFPGSKENDTDTQPQETQEPADSPANDQPQQPQPLPQPMPNNEVEETLTDKLLYWLPFALLLLLLLIVFWVLKKSQKEATSDILKQVQANEEARQRDMNAEKYKLSNLKLNSSNFDKDGEQMSFLKEKIVMMALNNRGPLEDYVGKLSSSEDEVSKASLAVLFNSMGRYQFVQLFGKVFSPKEVDKLELFVNEMNKEQGLDQQLPVLENIYKELLPLTASELDNLATGLAPFKFLSKLSDEKVLYLLNKEEPKIQALIISQLPTKRSAKLLGQLEPDVRNNVISEMADFEQMPMEIFIDVAADLARKSEKIPQINNFALSSLDVILSNLQQMDSTAEKVTLAQLEKNNPSLFQEIKKVHIGFADIVNIPSVAMKTLFGDIEKSVIAIALFDEDENFTKKLFANMNERLRASLESEMAEIKPTTQEINDAKRSMVSIARNMLKEGIFTIEELSGGGEKEASNPEK